MCAGSNDGRDAETIAAAALRVAASGRIATLVTLIEASQSVGAKLLIDESGGCLAGGTSVEDLDRMLHEFAPTFLHSRREAQALLVSEIASRLDTTNQAQLGEMKDWRVLFERVEPEPRLVVCGAGHVGAQLARLANLVGYRVTLIDDRAEFVQPKRFPQNAGENGNHIELVAAQEWRVAVRAAVGYGRGVACVVVTRGHNEDEECLRAVLEVVPDYVGMIGSRRRTNIVLERLRESGVDEKILREVRAPVGLDIGAVTPEEVALAILAEIVAERRGGAGASLSAWRRRTPDALNFSVAKKTPSD